MDLKQPSQAPLFIYVLTSNESVGTYVIKIRLCKLYIFFWCPSSPPDGGTDLLTASGHRKIYPPSLCKKSCLTIYSWAKISL